MNDQYEATFVWPHADASTVVLTGTFDQWKPSVHLTKTQDGFSGTVKLPYGEKVAYKYIVDGEWRTRDDEPQEHDGYNLNNVYQVPSHQQPVQTETPAPVDTVPTTNGTDVIASVIETPKVEAVEPVAAATVVAEEGVTPQRHDVVDPTAAEETSAPTLNTITPTDEVPKAEAVSANESAVQWHDVAEPALVSAPIPQQLEVVPPNTHVASKHDLGVAAEQPHDASTPLIPAESHEAFAEPITIAKPAESTATSDPATTVETLAEPNVVPDDSTTTGTVIAALDSVQGDAQTVDPEVTPAPVKENSENALEHPVDQPAKETPIKPVATAAESVEINGTATAEKEAALSPQQPSKDVVVNDAEIATLATDSIKPFEPTAEDHIKESQIDLAELPVSFAGGLSVPFGGPLAPALAVESASLDNEKDAPVATTETIAAKIAEVPAAIASVVSATSTSSALGSKPSPPVADNDVAAPRSSTDAATAVLGYVASGVGLALKNFVGIDPINPDQQSFEEESVKESNSHEPIIDEVKEAAPVADAETATTEKSTKPSVELAGVPVEHATEAPKSLAADATSAPASVPEKTEGVPEAPSTPPKPKTTALAEPGDSSTDQQAFPSSSTSATSTPSKAAGSVRKKRTSIFGKIKNVFHSHKE